MISQQQIDLTASIEGFSTTAYLDCVGVLTIGYGEVFPDGSPVKPGQTCTPVQAKKWLLDGMNKRASFLISKLGYTPCQNQLDAATDLIYNMGFANCPSFIAAMKSKNYLPASLQILNGIYGDSKPVLGLLRRRITNFNTFVSGSYQKFVEGDLITPELKSDLLSMNPSPKAHAMINSIGVKNA